MTMHKSCRLFTLCSHPCRAYSNRFQVHSSFLWGFTAGGTHQKNLRGAIPSFRGSSLVFFFALESVVLYVMERIQIHGADIQEVQWMLVKYIPEKANTYRRHQSMRRGFRKTVGWDSGDVGSPSFTCNILTCWVALGRSFWPPISFSTVCTCRHCLREIRNFLGKWSASTGRFLHMIW